MDLYIKLRKHILNDDTQDIENIYLYIIKTGFSDYDTMVLLMGYMYATKASSRYLNLLRMFGSAARSDSEISYFVAFYFLMNKSFYHAMIAFKLSSELDGMSCIYSSMAKTNIKFIEANELKLLSAIKSGSEASSERLKTIEKNIYEAVLHMIEYAKSKDTFRGSDDKSRFI